MWYVHILSSKNDGKLYVGSRNTPGVEGKNTTKIDVNRQNFVDAWSWKRNRSKGRNDCS